MQTQPVQQTEQVHQTELQQAQMPLPNPINNDQINQPDLINAQEPIEIEEQLVEFAIRQSIEQLQAN